MTPNQATVLKILKDQIRLVARPDSGCDDCGEPLLWKVKPGVLEAIAKEIGTKLDDMARENGNLLHNCNHYRKEYEAQIDALNKHPSDGWVRPKPRKVCLECNGRGVDEWGGTCMTCSGDGQEPPFLQRLNGSR